MGLIWIIALLALLALGWEVRRGRKVRFRRLELAPAGSGNDGGGPSLRLLHLSDLHLRDSHLRLLQQLAPLEQGEWDFIFITGDLIDDDSGITPVAEFLSRLRSRHGCYAVLGNHDYLMFKAGNPLQWLRIFLGAALRGRSHEFAGQNDIPRLIESLERAGVKVLRNSQWRGKLADGSPFQLFGLDDPSTGRDDPAPLYPLFDPAAVRMVLMHSPDRLEKLRPLRPHLVLCGHTHGGQVRLPWVGALVTASDAPPGAASGLVRLGGLRVFISPGIGAGRIFPFRLLAPPEVTEISLPLPPTPPEVPVPARAAKNLEKDGDLG